MNYQPASGEPMSQDREPAPDAFVVTKYPRGCFCWVEYHARDAAASAFYCELMGWRPRQDEPAPGYPDTLFLRDGRAVAGLRHSPAAAQEPTGWLSHVAVADVDALLAPVVAAGGSVIEPPRDIAGRGRVALIADPHGAALGLWQAAGFPGAALVNAPGAHCWNDIYTPDAARTREFYEAVFGWRFQAAEPGYFRITNGDRPAGGMLPMDEEMIAFFGANWMVYFSVADIEAAAARVEALGAELLVPPHEAATGRFLVFADPQGAFCSLFQLAEPLPWRA